MSYVRGGSTCVGNWPVDSAFNPESAFIIYGKQRKEIQYNIYIEVKAKVARVNKMPESFML